MDIRHKTDQYGLEFHVAVMKFLCLCGLSVGVPFGVWHLLWGNPMVAITLIPAMLVQALALYLLLRDGFNRWAALMVATVQVAGAVFYVYLLGSAASYWLFASSVANFYLIRWRSALTLNFSCCVVTAWLMRDDPEFMTRFVLNFTLVNLFLFAYTHQLEKKTEEVSRLLYRDPLTGTGNRLAMDAALQRVQQHRERYGTPVTLLMLDLDHFKQINDRHGHAAGDNLLTAFSRTVEDRLRATDSLYRFGGEEFVVIAENTALQEASTLARDIRARVEGAAFPPSDGITLSVGLAELQTGESIDNWLNRTDQALYRAKDAGRNRVESASARTPSTDLGDGGLGQADPA